MDDNNRRTAWQRTGGNTSRFIVIEDVEVPSWHARLSAATNTYPPQTGTSAANSYLTASWAAAQAGAQHQPQPHPFHGSVIRGVFGGLLG